MSVFFLNFSVNLDDDYMDDFSDDEIDDNYEKDILGDGSQICISFLIFDCLFR